jgi:hypothetical protein
VATPDLAGRQGLDETIDRRLSRDRCADPGLACPRVFLGDRAQAGRIPILAARLSRSSRRGRDFMVPGEHRRTGTQGLGLLAPLLLIPSVLLAQDAAEERTPPGRWVITSTLGAGGASSGYGEFLEKPVNFDLSISRGTGPWRVGFGIEFGSLAMKPPYEDQLEWARFDTYLFAQRLFNHEGRVRPYLQGRVGLARVHPRSELFWFEEPENLEPGASPTKATGGYSFTPQPGVEFQLHPTVSLDLSGWFTDYRTGDYSLTPPLHGPLDPPLSENETVNAGREYGFRAGLAWRPLAQGARVEPEPRTDPATGTFFSLPPADRDRDEWASRAAGAGPPPRCWGSTSPPR